MPGTPNARHTPHAHTPCQAQEDRESLSAHVSTCRPPHLRCAAAPAATRCTTRAAAFAPAPISTSEEAFNPHQHGAVRPLDVRIKERAGQQLCHGLARHVRKAPAAGARKEGRGEAGKGPDQQLCHGLARHVRAQGTCSRGKEGGAGHGARKKAWLKGQGRRRGAWG
eukprot:365088-Chlamydomonas_euryale.AAC.3